MRLNNGRLSTYLALIYNTVTQIECIIFSDEKHENRLRCLLPTILILYPQGILGIIAQCLDCQTLGELEGRLSPERLVNM